MGTYTSKRNLYKPAVGEDGWGTLVNANFDTLDRVGESLFPFRRKGSSENRWYCAGVNTADALTTGVPSANILRALPFLVPQPITIDQLAINVTASSASTAARLGVYADGGNLYPSTLIVDAGVVDTSSTGVKSLSINNSIEAGSLVWFVIVGNGGPTLRALPIAACMNVLGFDSTLGTASGVGWSVSFTYGVLPSTFPGAATAITTTPIPAIFARLV